MTGLRVLLSGMLAGDPHQGGASWAILQYALGLRALGHQVHLVEPVDRIEPASAKYFSQVVRTFGLERCAALLVRGTQETAGLPYGELSRAARNADILLNVAGMLRDAELIEPPPVRVYLDLDPAFVQLWHAVQGIEMGFDAHNRFATVGLELGMAGCPIPTCGREWIKTLPPVFLRYWEPSDRLETNAFTTVANWRAYGSIEWEGTQYGQKVHSLRTLIGLPEQTAERLVLALAIHPDESSDLADLRLHGWELVDPSEVAGSPDRYLDFIRGSKAELGIAKSGYVASGCGWFSDRSACYLASGRPVVAQETGFSRHLPVGQGLLSFTTAEEAAAAIDEVAGDYERHARAARALAEEVLDSKVVLETLLERVA